MRSKEVHVVALLRKALRLKQSDLAALVGCSAATIQSIEMLRLKISKRLAARISAATGVNVDWILNNDINVPMPPIQQIDPELEPEKQKGDATIALLFEILSRVFSQIRKLERSPARTTLEIFIGAQLEGLKNHTGSVPWVRKDGATSYSFLIKYPKALDLDLAEMINLKCLVPSRKRPSTKDREWIAQRLKGFVKEDFFESKPGDEDFLNSPAPAKRRLSARAKAKGSPKGQKARSRTRG
jgi:transcriptional regulator with XRE-family HTH domain